MSVVIDGFTLQMETLAGTELLTALVKAYQRGQQNEVLTFLSEAPREKVSGLRNTKFHVKEWGVELWWAFQQALLKRDVVISIDRLEVNIDAKLAARIFACIQGLPANHDQVIAWLMQYCVSDCMPLTERFAVFDWFESTHRIVEHHGYRSRCWVEGLMSGLTDAEQCRAIAVRYPELGSDAVSVFAKIAKNYPRQRRWQPWYDYLAAHPGQLDTYGQRLLDPALIEHCWLHAEVSKQHELLSLYSDALYSSENKDDWEFFRDSFDRMVQIVPDYFTTLLRERDSWLMPHVAGTIWGKQYDALVPLLLPAIGARSYGLGEFRPLVARILRECPAYVGLLNSAQLFNLMPLLDQSLSTEVLQGICKVMAGSSSKALREALAKALAKVPLADLEKAGWFSTKGKNTLLGLLAVLMGHTDPAAASQLQALLEGGKLDIASAEAIETHLKKRGLVSASPVLSGVVSLVDLEQQAAKVKRISAVTRPYETPEVLTLLEPLSEHAARVLLHLAATAEGELPGLAHALIAQVPAERRAQFAHSIIATWVALEGEPKARWALRLLKGSTDDRMVDVLADAALTWGKPKKQRAVLAVEQLAAIDSLYALARVQEISASRKVKEMVSYAARQALREAAARRKLTVAELYDELTPDFGLAKGITLQVGELAYQVVLLGDLTLRLVDAKGKASKSLPALKDEGLRAQWEAANAQYKTLQAGLKSVLKQQAPRMQAAFFTGTQWPLERWQRLFLTHPLLRVAGRSLIWQVQGQPGGSFRIAEDFSLLDVEDNVVELASGARIGLWHPVMAQEGEAQAWKNSLEDYRIEALVDQVGAYAGLPDSARFKNGQLLPKGLLVIEQGKLSGLFSKLGYKAGPVQDGPGIYEHDWLLPAAGILVRVKHSAYMPYMDLSNKVTIEGIEVYFNGRESQPDAIAKPLLATLEGHLQLLQEKALT